MKVKNKCCEKYRRKSKLCKACPLAVGLSKKQRKRWVKAWKKEPRRKAA